MRLLIVPALFAGGMLFVAGCGGSSQPVQVPVAQKPDTWEYTVLINASGEHSLPQLRGLVEKEGWEVHLVTGGQPYISDSHTANGKTYNTVKFTPRDYYLKRRK